jgi:hypothetical protein
MKYKKSFLITVLLIAGCLVSAVADTNSITNITMSGSDPAPIIWGGPYSTNWITGTFTISCTSTKSVTTTTDIAPRQETYERNRFTFINTGATVQLSNDEIYFYQVVYSTPVKMWGVDSSNVSSNNFFVNYFGTGTSSIMETYYFYFENDGFLAAGTYELPITIRTFNETYSKKGPYTDPVATLPVRITFLVNPNVSLAFRSTSGGSAISSVNFGTITTTATQSFVVNVTSNFRYALNVASANAGYIVQGSYKIPYTMTLNGNPVPLTSAGIVAYNYQPPTSGSGQDYAAVLTATVPDTLNQEGTYSDSLTFTVTAQ